LNPFFVKQFFGTHRTIAV